MKLNGKTARAWLIEIARNKVRRDRVSAHIALEEVYAEGQRAAEGSIYHLAATAYEGISQNQLERLIAAVERR